MGNLKLSNSAIEWTWFFGEKNGYTWNPGKGCLHDCTNNRRFTCWAEGWFKRFGKDLYPDMKSFQDIHWHTKDYNRTLPDEPSMIFVGATGDVSFWNDDWIGKAIEKIWNYSQHIFIFLTKNPNIYCVNEFDNAPYNCWFGASALNENEVTTYQDTLFSFQNRTTFLSIEPIEEEIKLDHFEPTAIDWLIIGGQTGPGEKFYPSGKWVGELWEYTRKHDIPIFFKDNFKMKTDNGIKTIKEALKTKIQEWPEAKE